MEEITLRPHAAAISQSLRDLGYSLETAIADLIDNSITAHAHNIHIYLDFNTPNAASLCIIDDGQGLNRDELIEAMRPGSRNPREERSSTDLGRFGLGLKTASFSQCKSLTVISRQKGDTIAAQWDLDLIAERNEWIVRLLPLSDLEQLSYFDELGQQGTFILWQKLDRLLEGLNQDRSKAEAYDKLEVVEKHLSLVFHRYLSGTYAKHKLNIFINGHAIKPFDPFCLNHKATQQLHEETVRIEGSVIKIQPYILPHHSKLSPQEKDFYESRGDFFSNQGAYVYRNGRLMAWGDWFRLVPKSEATKLARVQIDFTNTLDEHWTIDIKKSRATPPPQVRDTLRRIIYKIIDQSKLVYQGRSHRLNHQHNQPLWERRGNRERTAVFYRINNEHPLLKAFQQQLDTKQSSLFSQIMGLIEQAIPIEAIYSDYASHPESFVNDTDINYQQWKEDLKKLYSLLSTQADFSKEAFSRMILSTKPYSNSREVCQQIIEEL
jgi:hypothetical protein